jgi:hypothetical protein
MLPAPTRGNLYAMLGTRPSAAFLAVPRRNAQGIFGVDLGAALAGATFYLFSLYV